MRNAPDVRGLVLSALCSFALGCGTSSPVLKPADLPADWSRVPLPPDPELASLATAADSPCSGMSGGRPFRVVLQDRRTPAAAAFLVDGPELFGACLVAIDGLGSGGHGPALAPMVGALTIDEQASGGVGNRTVSTLGGRFVGASVVTVELRDGTSLAASLAEPYWLASWPSDVEARQVAAHDKSGALVATLEVPTVH